jgi:hypothetical protein
MCVNCGNIKESNMGAHCRCSGAHAPASRSRGALVASLAALRAVARFYGLEMLRNAVEWVASA